MQEKYSSEDDFLDKIGSEVGEDSSVEAAIHCLVGSLLAWGLFLCNLIWPSLRLAAIMLESWAVEAAINGKGSSQQHFRWRSGKVTRRIDLSGNASMSLRGKWTILLVRVGTRAIGEPNGEREVQWLEAVDSQAVVDTGSF